MAAGREAATLVVLFVGVLMGALDIAVVGPALPAVRAAFEVGPRWLPWVFSVYVLFYLLGTPLLAKRSDRLGRRRVYLESLVLFGTGSLLVAAAWSFPVLLVGRAVQAFGAGGLLPVAAAVIAETVPLERRGRTLGVIGAVFGVAFLLGPLLGGLLLHWSWRLLFVVNVPVAAALMVCAARWLPRAGRADPRPFDALGAVLLAIVLGAFVVGVGQLDSSALGASVASARVWPWLVVLAVGLLGLWRVEQRAADPVIPPPLLAVPRLRVVGLIALAAGLVEAAVVFLPDVVVLRFGLDAADASLSLLPLVATLAVGAPLAGALLDRFGARVVVQSGLALTIGGLVALALAPLGWAVFYVAGGFVGLGMSALLGAPLRYVVLHEAGEGHRAAGQAMLTLCVSVGQIVGATAIGGIAGSTVSALAGYRSSLLVVAVACALALMLSTVLRGRVGARGTIRAPEGVEP